MLPKRKAVFFAVLALVSLLAGFAGALLLPHREAPAVAAGFVGYLAFGRRAVLLTHADDIVFSPRQFWNPRPAGSSAVAAGIVAGTIGSFILGQSARPGYERGGGGAGRPSRTSDLLRFPQGTGSKRPTLN